MSLSAYFRPSRDTGASTHGALIQPPLWLSLMGVAVVYAALVWVVLGYITPSGKGSILFFASGFALAALLIGGWRYAWSILLGAIGIRLWFGTSLEASLIQSVGSVLSAMLGHWLLTRNSKFDASLPALADYLRLLAVGSVASLASAAIGTTALVTEGIIQRSEYGPSFLSWWLGDTLGVILVTAPCLLWASPRTGEDRAPWYEIAAISLAVFAAGQVVFQFWPSLYGYLPRGYWMFLFIFVAAVRLPPRWTALLLVLVSLQASLGVFAQSGSFATDQTTLATIDFWLYIVTLSLVGMALSIHLTQRKRTVATLRQQTAELDLYNHTLQQINAGIPLPTILDGLAREMERVLPKARCAILLLDRNSGKLIHGAAPSLPIFQTRARQGFEVGEGLATCGTAAHRGELVITRDISQDPGWTSELYELAKQSGVRSCWSQPILNSRREVIGTFALYHAEPDQPSPRELQRIERMGSLTALAIDQSQVQQDLRLKDMVLQASVDPTMIVDRTGRIIWANQALAQLTGYELDELTRLGATDIVKPDGVDPAVRKALWKAILAGESWHGEILNQRKDGHHLHQEMLITPIRHAAGEVTHFLAGLRDISERKRNEESLWSLAFHDPLTQLANRRLLTDRLQQAQAIGQRSGRHNALLLLDLDNFKPLNDRYGHGIGDLLLVEVARRISAAVRNTDTVARLGGDEFVVLLQGLDVDPSQSSERAQMIAGKIGKALAEPYVLPLAPGPGVQQTIEHRCTASIGVSVFAPTALPDSAVQWADMAMYQAKAAGRNQIVVHTSTEGGMAEGDDRGANAIPPPGDLGPPTPPPSSSPKPRPHR